MNRTHNNSVRHALPDGLDDDARDESEKCLLYLLGELSGQQLTDFERQLTESEALRDELLLQAKSIDELSKLDPGTTALRRKVLSSRIQWMLVATSTALAASLGWAIVGLRPDRQQMPVTELPNAIDRNETLMIAMVWADDTGANATEPDIVTMVEEDAIAEFDYESELESPLSWMVAAVSADADAFAPGDANDG